MIVGGIYREICLRPQWDEVYGSAGRAASAIARLGGKVALRGYLDADLVPAMQARAFEEGFVLECTQVPRSAAFSYTHGLAAPQIYRPKKQPALHVQGEKVLRFGLLEATAVVDADYAVYDPQNVDGPESFAGNGSKAKHLAVVLNVYEAVQLLGERELEPVEITERLAAQQGAEVVVLKLGAMGALVYYQGTHQLVPAYATTRVWKIGSGDQFSANFAYAWMEEGRPPVEAAAHASHATAFYAQHRDYPTVDELNAFAPVPLAASKIYEKGQVRTVYLAGPFFTLAQLWVVEQARNCLQEMGLKVFSPYHDVGHGPAELVVGQDVEGIRQSDVVLAIGDGLDSGTIFEVGYARALGIPVVVYLENESQEDCKMMEGTDCFLCDDFVSAIYRTTWVATSL